MSLIRSFKNLVKKYPLKHMTEDTTDEFNTNIIATKLYELVHFYKVNKNSLS